MEALRLISNGVHSGMGTVKILAHRKFNMAGADNPLEPKCLCQQEGIITMVICCKFKNNLFNLWLYTNLFMI